MKNLCIAVSAVLLATIQPISAQVQGQWVSTGTMQTQREFHAQVSIAGGKALSIGGADNSGNILASVELYSSSPGKWTLTGSMAEARESFPAVLLKNGKVLVSGGFGPSGTILSGAELYSPDGNMEFGRFPAGSALWSHRDTALQWEGVSEWRLHGDRLRHEHGG